MGGDPIRGTVEELRGKYISIGRIQEKTWREGDQVNTP